MQRRIAVITGTTHGIGRVTAQELAKCGMTVVMLCRNSRAGAAVRDEMLGSIPSAAVHVVHCDLASLASVRAAARSVLQDFAPLGLLINNAGMVSTRQRMSEDGYELTFAANHLGPFLLTGLLLGAIAEDGRLINVASRAHYRGILDLENIDTPPARYSAQAAYARSKLANVLHTFALARRLAGSRITANCLHPGIVATNLLPRWLRPVQRMLHRVIFDPSRGARSTLHLALADEVALTSGRYFDEHQCIQPASPLAHDAALQELLWTMSERWTGLAMDPTIQQNA
jgi:NAD(P)-dependent dehydrogenase (short-subunit alcohol dehydrogenase family)